MHLMYGLKTTKLSNLNSPACNAGYRIYNMPKRPWRGRILMEQFDYVVVVVVFGMVTPHFMRGYSN